VTMATEILMPRLGWTMEEGVFGQWLIPDGAPVKPGDLIFTVESDKATQEVEAFEHGILRIPPTGPQTGAILPVGALLGYILQPGEAAPFERESSIQAAEAPVVSGQWAVPSGQSLVGSRQLSVVSRRSSDIAERSISPRARRVARELGVDWSSLLGSGATGRIIERDIRAAAAQLAAQPSAPSEAMNKVRATPVAARLAQEAGIDLATLARQKGGERIERADVEAAIAARGAPAPVPPSPAAPTLATPTLVAPTALLPASESLPISHIRRVIAQRMAESAQTTAPVTLTTEADAGELVALREQLKTTFGPRNLPIPSYNDLLIKLTAVALQAHPLLNATWREDEIVLHKAIHMGLAVESEDGLLAPVVRDVQNKSVRQLASEMRGLLERAQSRRLTPDELQGGTFTITNLGMYGIDAFTPIINLPQCAILGVGRIIKKPAVVNDQVLSRQMLALSLTFDHRLVDGAPAARFLNTVREYVESPVLWLAG
jgi:pyruvate dehydrogenase E2 component (dihydrolipoamide acetyltransferase)